MSEIRHTIQEVSSAVIVGGNQGRPGERTVPKGCYSVLGEWILCSVEPPMKDTLEEPWYLLAEDQEMPVVPVRNEQGDIAAVELELMYGILTSRVQLNCIRDLAKKTIEQTLNREDTAEPTSELGSFLHRGGMIELDDILAELPER